jgi:hypothetical protein
MLNDLKFFASGLHDEVAGVIESALAKRARDAIREIGYPTGTEIAKGAGLTTAELSLALHELTTQNHVIENRNNRGEVHYALKYAH